MIRSNASSGERWQRHASARSALTFAIGEALRGIVARPGQAIMLAMSVAIGVALALAIIAASRGVEVRVTRLLEIDPAPPEIQFDEIDRVLTQTRDLLIKLAFGFTAALVGAVTWMSIG